MADEKEVKQPADKTPQQVANKKAYWIALAIAFGVSIPLCVGSFFLIRNGLVTGEWDVVKYRVLADTFTLPGVLYAMAFMLVFASNYGAFDAITYSVRLVWTLFIHSDVRKTKLPANYRDYRLMKSAKPRVKASFLLFIGLGYLLLAVLFIILFYANK